MKLTKRTKRLLIAGALVLGLPIGAILLLAQNSARYPGAGVTTGDLFIASNYATTTLLTQISATATSATVASGSGFVAPQLVSIDSEIVSVCQVSGNTLTFGKSACPNVDGRGYDGSVAVSHIASRPVEGRVVAWLHNQLAAEVIAIEMRPAGKFYAPAYVSLASAVSAAGSSGTVVAPAGYTANVATTITVANSVSIELQPGAVVQAAANVPLFAFTGTNQILDGGGGGIVDGQLSQHGYSSSCVIAAGTSGLTVRKITIRNCGYVGVYFDGTTTINQHVKVLDSVFTSNHADALYSQGMAYDFEWAGNYADGSTNAAATHTFAIHYQQAGTTPPHAIKIHDNVLVAGPYFAIEVGSFIAPYPKSSWPYDVHLSHNTCLIPADGRGCDSLSDVQDFSVDYEIADAQGHLMLYTPEVIATNGTVHGVVQKNCNASQTDAIVVNQSADIDVSGNSFCGSIHVGISGPAGNVLDISMDNNRIHDNSVTLQPGYTAAVLAGGGHPAGIWVQHNDPLVHMHNLDIHDNAITGNSTTDGTLGVLLENDPCTSTADIDQVHVHHNTINAVQYGLGNQTGCSFITNVDYTDNLLGSGMAQFGGNVFGPSITYRNLGFPSPVPVNSKIYKPTACVTGTGLDAGGINCLANLRGGGASGAGAGTQTAYSGTLVWSTTTPTTGILFTLTMPAGAFSAGPICQVFSAYLQPQTVLFSISSSNTATTVGFNSFTILPPGVQVEIGWHCEPN